MVVLDTHAWIWSVDAPERLSDQARGAIDEADAVGVPAICCWELGVLVTKGRVRLDRDPARWIRDGLAQRAFVSVPITAAIATTAALLPYEGLGRDPADRLIYATARDRGAPLVTRDDRMRRFDPRGTIW